MSDSIDEEWAALTDELDRQHSEQVQSNLARGLERIRTRLELLISDRGRIVRAAAASGMTGDRIMELTGMSHGDLLAALDGGSPPAVRLPRPNRDQQVRRWAGGEAD